MCSETATASDRPADPVISVRALSKAYRMYERPTDRLRQAFAWGRHRYYHEFWALRDVHFDVYPGEMVGIVGRNGSGKSTLLQIIAGTLAPTAGSVRVQDRVSALLELGSGFDPDFTGRENVFFSGAISGLSRQAIEQKYDAITAFADIGEFIEQPLRTYSTGMAVRLAFAVQLFAAERVLIVDEALAVGDEGFQRKCIAALERFQADGGTILLVTHDTQTVVKMCDRAVLLDHGEVLAAGASKRVIDIYQKLLYSSCEDCDRLRAALRAPGSRIETVTLATAMEPAPAPEPATPASETAAFHDTEMVRTAETTYGGTDAEIVDVGTFDATGQPANVLVTGQPCELRYRVRFHVAAVGVRFGMMLKTKEGVDVAGVSNAHVGRRIDRVEAGQVVAVCFRLTMNLAPGTYFLNTGVGCLRNGDEVYLHRRVDVAAIRVIPCDDREIYGLAFVAPEVSWAVVQEGASSNA